MYVCGGGQFQRLLIAQSWSLRAILGTSPFPCPKMNDSCLYFSQNTAQLTNKNIPRKSDPKIFPFYFPMKSAVEMTPLVNEFFLILYLHFSVFSINLIHLAMCCAKGKQETLQGIINHTNQSRDN